jgi:hypothetical protein
LSYFNLTDKEISVDHSWNSKTPLCQATEYNYYTYLGLILRNEADLKERLQNTLQHKKTLLLFKFIGNTGLQTNQCEKLHQIIKEVRQNRTFLSSLFSTTTMSWSISYNDKQKVFKIIFRY